MCVVGFTLLVAERVCGNSVVFCCGIELVERCMLTSLCVTLDEVMPISTELTLCVAGEFVYLGFYVAFNTVQVISRRVVGRAEETSTYSSLGFCTVNCRPTASNYQLSHLRP